MNPPIKILTVGKPTWDPSWVPECRMILSPSLPEALRMVPHCRPHVVVLDDGLPAIDRAVLRFQRLWNGLEIWVQGDANGLDDWGLRAGRVRWLTKPVAASDLKLMLAGVNTAVTDLSDHALDDRILRQVQADLGVERALRYVRSAQEYIAIYYRELCQGDGQAVVKAHSLKGLALSCGLEMLGRLAERLEGQLLQGGNLSGDDWTILDVLIQDAVERLGLWQKDAIDASLIIN